MLIDALRKEWKKKGDRGWELLYIVVDLHDTLVESHYDGLATKFYPEGIECLRGLSKREDVCLILWTSSYRRHIDEYLAILSDAGVNFDFFNENPNEENTKTGDFSRKFYFNILLDDKAGFVPEDDWKVVQDFFHDEGN